MSSSKRRGVSNRELRSGMRRIEQIRQSPAVYGHVAVDETVTGAVFDTLAGVHGATGNGISRAKQWRAHQVASRQEHPTLAADALLPSEVYTHLLETFASIAIELTPTESTA